MKLTDLYKAIKELGPQKSYYLNDDTKMNTDILKYDIKRKIWEYYFLNERGGKSNFKTFDTEEKACEYAINEAIDVIKVFKEADMDAIRRKYLGLNTYMTDNLIQRGEIKITDLYEAIKKLEEPELFCLSNCNKIDHYVLKYNEESKHWEYYFLDDKGGKIQFKTFESEAKACEYVLLEAIRIIKDLRNAHMDAVRNKYLGLK